MPLPFDLAFLFTPDFHESADAYARQLKQLLPPGNIWNMSPDSVLSKVLLALATELARIESRGADLIEESDPRTADVTLPQWDQMLGLPDDRVTTIPVDLAEHQIAVTQKYVSRGGQSVPFFVALAASCGYSVTISRYSILRAGFRAGDRVYDIDYAYAFRLNVSPPVGAALPQADFERIIRHAVHSHNIAVFNYL